MKFINISYSHLLIILLGLTFFTIGHGNTHTKVTFLGVSSSVLSARMSEQLNLPPNVYLSVDQVSIGSPASEAGLKLYDVILKLDDQILVNSPQLKALVRMKKPGDRVELKILRKGKPLTLQVTLSEVEKPFNTTNPRFGMRKLDTLKKDLFSQDFDSLSQDMDSFIRDFLQENERSRIPKILDRINSDETHLNRNSPLHKYQSNPPSVQSFSFSSKQKHIVIEDDNGTIEFTVKDGRKHLQAKDKEGNSIFDGPVDTVQQRKKLPKNIREKLQKIDSSV